MASREAGARADAARGARAASEKGGGQRRGLPVTRTRRRPHTASGGHRLGCTPASAAAARVVVGEHLRLPPLPPLHHGCLAAAGPLRPLRGGGCERELRRRRSPGASRGAPLQRPVDSNRAAAGLPRRSTGLTSPDDGGGDASRRLSTPPHTWPGPGPATSARPPATSPSRRLRRRLLRSI